MADIRIKDLAVTAGSSASDDYLAVDGSTNGTRKLNAYSPTFGGNLTVSGTGTIAGLTLSGGSFAAASLYKSASLGTVLSGATGSSYDLFITNPAGSYIIQTPTGTRGIQVAGNISAAGDLSASGNLTVSGTGTSSVAGNLGVGTTSPASRLHVKDATGTAVTLLTLETAFNNPSGNKSIVWTDATSPLGRISVSYDAANGSRMSFGSLYNSGYQTSDLMTLANTGNLLIGKTIDSSNGRLQLADHTTSAGGIGFGTDVSLYRVDTSNLRLSGKLSIGAVSLAGANDTFGVYANGRSLKFNGDSAVLLTLTGGPGDAHTINATPSTSLSLQTNSITALTLDSSQNATFAGSIAIGNTVNTVSPTSPNRTITMVIGGTTYYIHAKTTND